VFESDLAELPWRKSSFSGPNGCVEAAPVRGGLIAVRDSKNPQGGHLLYNALEWQAFLAGVRHGEFDYLAPTPSTPELAN
jgi:Domain of unknown function (DUF397)